MTTFALKLIALTAMMIDHVGEVGSGRIPYWLLLRLIGRTAFPLYAFMIAEGCRHTRDMKKYLLRLGAFALISEIPFDLCFENPYPSGLRGVTFLSFNYQNVFFNLFLSVLAIYIFDRLRGTKLKALGVLAVPAAMAAAQFIRADYGAKAVLIIFALYVLRGKAARVAAMVAGSALIYLPNYNYTAYLFGRAVSFGLAAFLAGSLPAVFVAFYNGKRGPGIKYFFYAMYPLHLLILAAYQILPAI